MTTPEQADAWVGLDVGKEEHFAEILDNDVERIFAGSVFDDQTALEALLDRASENGTAGLMIDQPGSIAQLILGVARGRRVPVAFVPGWCCAGPLTLTWAKPRPTNATPSSSLTWAGPDANRSTGSMSAPTSSLRLGVVNGFDDESAAVQTRLTNRPELKTAVATWRSAWGADQKRWTDSCTKAADQATFGPGAPKFPTGVQGHRSPNRRLRPGRSDDDSAAGHGWQQRP